eukprot:3644769-Amphidinium_carterae.1
MQRFCPGFEFPQQRIHNNIIKSRHLATLSPHWRSHARTSTDTSLQSFPRSEVNLAGQSDGCTGHFQLLHQGLT